MRSLNLILIFGLFPLIALASQEGVLPFSEFKIKSNGIGESGVVIVTGKKNNQGIFTSIIVDAFGENIKTPHEILNKIHSKYHNGIQFT